MPQMNRLAWAAAFSLAGAVSMYGAQPETIQGSGGPPQSLIPNP